MHASPQSSFLSLLFTEKGASPFQARIIQDNPKQPYHAKRNPLRIRSTSDIEGRGCRWTRTSSDLSLKAPSRHRSGQSPPRGVRNAFGNMRSGSDISLFVESRCHSSYRNNTFIPTLTSFQTRPCGRNLNAGWDQFDESAKQASRISALAKNDLFDSIGSSRTLTPTGKHLAKSTLRLGGKSPTSVKNPPISIVLRD